ncbi:MAG TPA: hypothetical protein VK866_04410 [Acidimicrobiales bacterium]|nr:hypothetical protein [Acidimicrobiales bacterium]
MRTRYVIMAVLAAVALTAAACGDDTTSTDAGAPVDDTIADPGSDGAGADGAAGDTRPAAITVAEALELPDGAFTPVMGFVVVDGDSARICAGLLESFPPQCGSPALVIENPDALAGVDLTVEGAVSWSDDQLTIDGVRRGDDGFTVNGVVDDDWTDTPDDGEAEPLP